jgi:hypothetical protein
MLCVSFYLLLCLMSLFWVSFARLNDIMLSVVFGKCRGAALAHIHPCGPMKQPTHLSSQMCGLTALLCNKEDVCEWNSAL